YHLERVANLPLGILDPTDYEQFAMRLEFGDLVVLYTDAVVECDNPEGKQLGEAGLLESIRRTSATEPEGLCQDLANSVRSWRAQQSPQDDQTIIVLQRSESKPPTPSIGRSLRTLAKMLGLERV